MSDEITVWKITFPAKDGEAILSTIASSEHQARRAETKKKAPNGLAKRGPGRPRKDAPEPPAVPTPTKLAPQKSKPKPAPKTTKPAPTKTKTTNTSVSAIINKALDEGVTSKDELMGRAAKAGFRAGPIAAFWINQIKKGLLTEDNGVVKRAALS